MDTEIGPCPGQEQALSAADRDVHIAIIAQLQATVLEQQRVIERLERLIAELEGQAKPGGVKAGTSGLIRGSQRAAADNGSQARIE